MRNWPQRLQPNAVITGFNTAPSATITTTANNSILTWVDTDDTSANDPSTRAYLSGAVEDGLADGHLTTSSVHYYAYQTAASAGSQTIGMSLPAGQRWTMVGIEVLDAASGPSTPPGAAFMTFF